MSQVVTVELCLASVVSGYRKCVNALAETVNGYYKTELIRAPARNGAWKRVEATKTNRTEENPRSESDSPGSRPDLAS
jgi:hypothetical protein